MKRILSPVESFTEHLDLLFACRACPNVQGQPVTGAVPGARIMLIGQAPGPHEVVERRPFAYTAGRRLFGWFERLGVSEESFRRHVHIAAVIRCFPGRTPRGDADRLPTPEEIVNCGRHLDREIAMMSPELLIAVGTLAARVILGESELAKIVGRMHRCERAGRSFDLVVLPHPSGRSTWLNDAKNDRLLDRSLKLIAKHPAFKRTFG
ncbi:MAG TPA: uracil-DNA glycosylase family protein [Gemmatimonadaceae bacterium]|nr:uracil-DNA glycosylase family protein [Gemmatimonadaceae bacterium]